MVCFVRIFFNTIIQQFKYVKRRGSIIRLANLKVNHLIKRRISMAEYKQKDQSFKLWKNKYKNEGDKIPDYTGNGLINGE